MIRFARRYIQQSFRDELRTFLSEYGWLDGTAVPAAGSFSFMERAPKPADMEVVGENTVFASFGDEPDVRPLELGGGLLRTERVFFVDVIAEKESVGDMAAGEIKDRLTGLIGGTRYLRPRDAQGVQLPGYMIEIVDVALRQATGDRRNWFIVDGTLQVDFPGSDD